jgi:hypothetical protein
MLTYRTARNRAMSHQSRTFGIALSAASAAFSALVWTAMYVGGTGIPIALPFAILGGIAVLAVLHSWLAVYVVFVVRFLPVGLYMLGTPSWLAAAGVLDMTYLAGGILMHAACTETDRKRVRARR